MTDNDVFVVWEDCTNTRGNYPMTGYYDVGPGTALIAALFIGSAFVAVGSLLFGTWYLYRYGNIPVALLIWGAGIAPSVVGLVLWLCALALVL